MITFKLIIAGGRDFEDYRRLRREVSILLRDYLYEIEVEIVSGMAPGADRLGAQYAREKGLKLHKFPAQWKVYGKAAGMIRNNIMANFSQGLVVFWDGKSVGTKDMIERMNQRKKPVIIRDY